MRWVYYLITILGGLIIGIIYPFWQPIEYLLFLYVPYVLIGIIDIFSRKHTILRNYPVIGHFRYMLEAIRPEIQQYFIEPDQNGAPYSREIRSLVYQRAKNERDTIAFGTKNNITEIGYQFSYHSIAPKHISEEASRITIGGPDCMQPYCASRLNISGMSFGALSPNALRALNKGAKLGNFAHNTGEGGISPYHLQGGDIIWQIGTGYFGCRTPSGGFDAEEFERKAKMPEVKMIEIKISQGAKPAHGGVLPGVKVNEEIARIRTIPIGKDAISPPMHTEFSTPEELMHFIVRLRKLSGGKPIGFKLCIGIRSEFMGICKAMIKTGVTPDFITVDGAEGGTGAAPVIFTNHLGTPINEAVIFVHNCLVGINKRDKIKIIASGKVATGYDMVTKIALGADSCNVARAMMFALGCVQSLSCNTNCCPTGVATQNPHRWKSLDVRDKYIRVANYHKNTMRSFLEIVGVMGKGSPDELDPSCIRKYADISVSRNFAEMYPVVKVGEFLKKGEIHPSYKEHWDKASEKYF